MELDNFFKNILNKDIPINTLKTILYMSTFEENEIEMEDLYSGLYISKQKLVNELKKIKPIDGYLNLEILPDKYIITVLGNSFFILDGAKAKKVIKANIEKGKKDEIIDRLFQYWCSVMGKNPKSILDHKRRTAILKGLDTHTFEQCKLAILGCSKNLWNMGLKDGNTTFYNSLDLIFRNIDKIDNFIIDASKPSLEEQLNKIPKSSKGEDRLNDNNWLNNRAGMVGDSMSDIREIVKKPNERLIAENEYLKHQKNDKPKIENKIITNDNIDKLINDSFSKLFQYKDKIEDEIVVEDYEIVDETPYYLKVNKNKNKRGLNE